MEHAVHKKNRIETKNAKFSYLAIALHWCFHSDLRIFRSLAEPPNRQTGGSQPLGHRNSLSSEVITRNVFHPKYNSHMSLSTPRSHYANARILRSTEWNVSKCVDSILPFLVSFFECWFRRRFEICFFARIRESFPLFVDNFEIIQFLVVLLNANALNVFHLSCWMRRKMFNIFSLAFYANVPFFWCCFMLSYFAFILFRLSSSRLRILFNICYNSISI